MKIYVINLETAAERRERMESLLGGLRLDYEIVRAVLGAALSAEDRRQFEHHETMSLSPGELGCLLSHVKCWRRFLESPDETAIICEDDIRFSPRFPQLVAELHIPADEDCAVRFETYSVPITIDLAPVQRCGPYRVHRMLSMHAGAGTYALNRRAAEALLHSYRKMQNPVDLELFSPEHRNIGALAVYQVVPAPCIQERLFLGASSEDFLKSQIGDERKFVRVSVKDRSRRLRRLKRNLRPLVCEVESLLLRFKGERRLQVPHR
jgi:glycosyl transferase family 25